MCEKVMPMIYIDMDGVIAKWDTEASLEDTFEKGYFLNREPDEKMVGFVKKLYKIFPSNICILSSVYVNAHAEREKREWLDKNGLGELKKIFVPYGNRKESYAKAEIPSILIDDFSQNLHSWESIPEHTGIKYMNGINGMKGSWKGEKMTFKMSDRELMETLLKIVFAVFDEDEKKEDVVPLVVESVEPSEPTKYTRKPTQKIAE